MIIDAVMGIAAEWLLLVPLCNEVGVTAPDNTALVATAGLFVRKTPAELVELSTGAVWPAADPGAATGGVFGTLNGKDDGGELLLLLLLLLFVWPLLTDVGVATPLFVVVKFVGVDGELIVPFVIDVVVVVVVGVVTDKGLDGDRGDFTELFKLILFCDVIAVVTVVVAVDKFCAPHDGIFADAGGITGLLFKPASTAESVFCNLVNMLNSVFGCGTG